MEKTIAICNLNEWIPIKELNIICISLKTEYLLNLTNCIPKFSTF